MNDALKHMLKFATSDIREARRAIRRACLEFGLPPQAAHDLDTAILCLDRADDTLLYVRYPNAHRDTPARLLPPRPAPANPPGPDPLLDPTIHADDHPGLDFCGNPERPECGSDPVLVPVVADAVTAWDNADNYDVE